MPFFTLSSILVPVIYSAIKYIPTLVNDLKKSKSAPTISSPPKDVSGVVERNKEIALFQEDKRKAAESIEVGMTNSFKDLFDSVVSEIEKSTANELKQLNIKIDFVSLKKEIIKNSKDFDNIVRDYINEKINTSDFEFEKLTKIENKATREEELDKFGKQVLNDAIQKLLAQFDKSVANTSQYIEDYIANQTKSIESILLEQQRKYTNLSGSKEEIDNELLLTGQIVAITTLIETTTQEKISA